MSKLQFPAFDPDDSTLPAIAARIDISENEIETPVHRHRKGQLVLALRGGVVCDVPGARWMVPPTSGVWIPGGMLHSNRATTNAQICFLFVEPAAAQLPDRCCTLSISPMIREMILQLAVMPGDYCADSHCGRLARVLLDELIDRPVENLSLPISRHPKLRLIADTLTNSPSDRTTLSGWAARLAMSERSLSRLIDRETGLTFGRWRQQLHILVALRELSGGSSVQRVASTLGYDSTTAFITMFKKVLGKSPGKYFQDRLEPHSSTRHPSPEKQKRSLELQLVRSAR
ncbi:helix-turn-helix transcriptional regulator [Bradyrhizobium sp. 27S5]|uniref:AraC family transcriptional regulator n=1 Tax=Bradyrhizobium sp. 27S5 TaxID=3139728 RepID=UPI0030D2A8D4